MPPLVLPSVYVFVGFVALVFGGELLVRGASGLASLLKISSLVIGLTVVAFGTSAPELAVAIQATLSGQSAISVGNIVGSNIFNVLAILGCSALIAPLIVSRQLIRLDVPLMVAVSFLALGVAYDGTVSRIEGTCLFLMLLVYTAWLVFQSRRETKRDELAASIAATEAAAANTTESEDIPGLLPPDTKPTAALLLKLAGLIVAGLILLSIGSHVLVDGASTIALAFGVSELMIGLTIVAIGTSLPEAATSVMASIRGERDIAVGNVVGSNVFNILSVMGLAAVVSPTGLAVEEAAVHFDLPVMIAVAVACLPVFFTHGVITRWEGGLFVFYYVLYMISLVMTSGGGTPAGWFSTLLLVVFPLTAIILIGSAVSAIRTSLRDKAGTADQG